MERRLAAILAADVVGYSRLMEQNEVDTFQRLQMQRKELFEPEIEKHHGRIFKLMGDGLLAEFGSVVDAVECAVVLQQGMAQRNAGAAPEQRINVRIGINLGDVIIEGDDRHGDGVNIAARLQQLADPGAVVISGTAYDQVKNKLALSFAHLGRQQVKNIAEPIRLYRVTMDDPAKAGNAASESKVHFRRWLAIGAMALTLLFAGAAAWWHQWGTKFEPASIERLALPLPDKPSIAVLPFANMSDDPKQEYFADGMTDDLITDLAKISDLFVISHNSTAIYKRRRVPPKQVSEELGVRYVLEGSIQRAGDRVRINAQLIDAFSGGHVWADRFDGSLTDVFALQDEVTRRVVDALALRLTQSQQQSLSQNETSVPGAYDVFLRGWEHYRSTTPDGYAKAIPFFEEAIKLDPNYGRPYAALAMIYVRSAERRWTASLGITGTEAYQRGRAYLAKAMKLPTAMAHQVAGLVLLGGLQILRPSSSDAPMAALAEFKQALSLDPGDSWNYMHMALALVSLGRSAEAVTYLTTAMRLDPHPPAIFMYYVGLAQFNLERFEEAATTLKNATVLNPDDQYAFLWLAATYGHLGRRDEAQSAINRANDLLVQQGYFPVTIRTFFEGRRLYVFQMADRLRFRDGLRLAGVPEFLSQSTLAAKNRLTRDESRSLFVGHRLQGRDLDTGAEWEASITADGIITSSGVWGSVQQGTVQFYDDRVCFGGTNSLQFCGTVFRNPGGTRAKQNEFIWDSVRGIRPFSQAQ